MPSEVRAVHVDTITCSVTEAFWQYNATTVAVRIDLKYRGEVLYSGVVGKPGLSPPQANWIVLRIISGRENPTWVCTTLNRREFSRYKNSSYKNSSQTASRCEFHFHPNDGLYPLLSWSAPNLFMKVMPNWKENYTVGTLTNGDQAYLEKTSHSLIQPHYEIYLGPNLQLTPTQDSGQPTALPASVRWITTTANSYWVAANATSSQCSQFVINFTAMPMQRMTQWMFNCPATSRTDDFNHCRTAGSLTFGWDNAYAPPGVSHSTWIRGRSSVELDNAVRRSGTVSLRLVADGDATVTYGGAALIWDLTQLGVTTDLNIQVVYNILRYGDGSVDEITYIQFEVQTQSGTVYLYYIKTHMELAL